MDLKDYREVPERIAEWYSRHEEGRIVCSIVEALTDDTKWTVRAAVYRTSDPNEPPAGVGHSFLSVPGKTNFTRESELENAETSAAGRALVMAGIPAKNVASEGEVRAKSAPVEPVASTSQATQGTDGMAGADAGARDTADGEDAATRPPAPWSGGTRPSPAAPDVSAPSGAPSTDQEQADAYIQVLRDGPGVAQSVLMARKLYATQVRKVPNLRSLSLDELLAVVQSFAEKREDVPV